MKNLLRAFVLFAVLCVSATAGADAFYDTYQRGLSAFKNKDYPTARAEFLRAYDLRPEPIVLFNVAQTYRLEQNTEQALDYYNRFLGDSKIAEDLRIEAQGYVTALEAQQRAREAQAKLDTEALPREADGSPVTLTSPPMDRSPSEPLAMDRSPSEPLAEPSRRRSVPRASWIALGVGGLGMGSAIVVGALGLGAESDLASNPMATQADADRVERYQLATNVSWAVAGAAVVTSIVLYFAAPAYTKESKSIVVAPVGDGGWTASVTSRF